MAVLKIGRVPPECKKDRYGREWRDGQWSCTEKAYEQTLREAEEGGCEPRGIAFDNWAVVITPPERKKAWGLAENVKYLVERHGLERIGFLTLTFAENLTDFREANRRFNSLRTHVLKELFSEFIVVVEPQKRGAVHFHLLVACRQDIRTGFDFDGIAKRDYSSASPFLRGLWKVLREAMPRYGFGRSELLPVKSSSEGMARYVGKYIGKGSRYRGEEFKGARMVRYSRGWRSVASRWSWAEHARPWRQWLGEVAGILGIAAGDMETFRNRYGRYWAWRLLRLFEEDLDPLLAASLLTQVREV